MAAFPPEPAQERPAASPRRATAIDHECDVLIIGAGLAGGCLARQLRLQIPELHVVMIDKKTNFDHWVGESAVEVWMDYATRVLKLGAYLMKHHIRKSGQRFFFDSAEKNLPLTEMSENGRESYDLLGGMQLDRAKFDRDLCELNRRLGVEIHLGTKVLRHCSEGVAPAIELDRCNGHRVHTSGGTFRCHWLIDAAGRSSPLVRQLGLEEYEPRHLVGSYWGRFEGCRDIDSVSDDSTWQRRTNGRPLRFTSTNHFMYRGYWIWLIPLSDTLMSIGVTFSHDIAPMSFKNGHELLAFFRQHPGLSEAVGPNAELRDFCALKRLPRIAKQQFSRDRWFLTGMSGMFTDPMLSSTSAQIAQSNRLIGEMIRTDRSGDAARFDSQVRHFNLAMRARYDSQIEVLRQYQFHGSFDVWNNVMGAVYSMYYIAAVPDGTTDYRFIIDLANAHATAHCNCEQTMRAGSAIRLSRSIVRLAREFQQFLDKTGRYYERNQGHWCDPTILWARPGLDARWFRGRERDLASERAEAKITYRNFCRAMVQRMAEIEGVPFSEERFNQSFRYWHSAQTLAALLAAQRSSEPESPSLFPVGENRTNTNPQIE
jgi:flavin-dependent dehydrogenase